MSNHNHILSCDIGGTHITSAIVDKRNWTILEETITRSHVNSLENAKSILHDWTSNMLQCLEKYGENTSQVGIAAPGPFDYEHGIALMKGQSKYDAIYNMQVGEPIVEALGNEDLEIRFINDAAAFLQGEIFGGGLAHKNCVLGITLGTGLGSAVWQNGEKAFDADLWNTPYLDSIYEEYLVTRWFIKRFKELTGIQEKGLKEIIQFYGDLEETRQLMYEYSEHLMSFLRFFSDKFKCKSFVIGGNIVKAWNLIFPDAQVFGDLEIEIGKYQEHAAIIGAASIFSTEL